MLRDWRQVSLERTDQKANWKKRRKHAFITGEMVQLGCILIKHISQKISRNYLCSLSSLLSRKRSLTINFSLSFFFFFLIEFHESRSLIGNKCVRQERNANHGPCRNDEILRSVSCYKCVVTDLNLAQGCVTCSVESLSFYFLS